MRLFLRGTIISSYHQMANDKIISKNEYLEFIQNSNDLKIGFMSKLQQIYFRKTDITFPMK